MTDAVLAPFAFAFFRNGLAAATLAGALCGLVGTYVVLKRMSYIGHGLSHAIFGGFAASALLGVNVLLGAGVWGVASALLIARVSRRGTVGADAAIGVVTTASFALGLALFAVFGQAGSGSFDALLFGSILGVGVDDVAVLAGVLVAAGAVVALGYRRLLFTTFDPEVAAVYGVRTGVVDAVLSVLLAIVILASMKVLGVTLIAAALVIPPTVARMLTASFPRMLWTSTVVGALCGAVGMIASYHADVQAGPSIVLVGGALFATVFVATGRRGLRRVATLDRVA